MEIPVWYPFPWHPPLEVPEAVRNLRRRAVVEVMLPTGDPALLVTRYKDVLSLFADPRLSRNIARPDAARITRDNDRFSDPNIDPDPPAHTRVRGLVTRALTGSRVEALRPVARGVVDALLDAMAAQPRPVDLNRALAFPLPLRVMCELLGVPAGERARCRELVDGFLSVTRLPPPEVRRARLGLRRYLDELIQSKRDTPGDDLVSALIRVTDGEGDRLTEHELGYWTEGLLIAGYVTTASQLGTGTAVLLHRRDLVEEIRGDWALIPTAVEELLRMQIMSSSIGTMRYATTDIELSDGTVIKKGSSVVLAAESANVDEDVFENPFTLDIRRRENHHLSFGAGPHLCVGADLARMQLQVATEALLRRFPDIRLARPGEELTRGADGFCEGFSEIPVTW
ncbi:MAG TPA: cytochrome P450 [Actinophytocola sp.]|uniref:cytochrome P450 n=1 Tax=Actinophytocola sp. TaxID=1872138 RepID=UPI002DDCC6C9|nr:cytochrome P450 [Actinophytocola sp.]HEV2778608.1 cytochrome P450 [Actinophytocola sp.]